MTKCMQEIAALADWTIREFRKKWEEIYGSPPPPGMSRDILNRAVVHHLQETALGGLDRKTERRLRVLVKTLKTGGEAASGPASAPGPGTRYVREWRGRTYSVIALPDGFDFKGKRYRYRSRIAREIAGTRWSGPKFFGIAKGDKA